MQRSQSPLEAKKPYDKRYVSPGNKSRSPSPNQVVITFHDKQSRHQIFSTQGQPVPVATQPSNITNFSRHSDASFQSQTPAYLYIPCPSHPDLFITNICKSKECVEPLCPECITQHLEMHTRKDQPQAKIENIQRVRKECCQLLYAQIDRLKKDSTELRNHSIGSQQTHYQGCVETLRQQHQRILDMIDDYFESMEKELKEKLRGVEQLKKSYMDLDNQVQDDIKTLETYAQQLQGSNYVRLVIQLLEEDSVLQGKRKLGELEKAIQIYEDQLPIVQAANNSFEYLRGEIKKVCYITTKQIQNQSLPPVSLPPKSQAIQSPQLSQIPTQEYVPITQQRQRQGDSNQKTRKQISSMYNDSTNNISNVLSHIPEQPISSDTHDFLISTVNHFSAAMADEDKYIASFEEDSKKMHMYYIADTQHRVQSFTLAIDFRIPNNHRQIASSEGIVFITGGVYREKNRFKASDLVYRLDLDSMSLKSCPQMNHARAMHSLCQLGNYLYAFGGTSTNDENACISKCEKMDLQTLRWTPITDCKYKTTGSAVVPYGDKYIFKIGGKIDIFTPCTAIEVYDVQRDCWSELDYQFSGAGYLRLAFNCSAVAIGERKILVFGGSVHDVKSNESSIITLSDNLLGQAQIATTRSLPRPVEFTTTQALVEYNQIWTFYDVSGKKRVLFGSENGWKEY